MLDDKLILPNGTVKAFTTSNVGDLQKKAAKLNLIIDDVIATPSEAASNEIIDDETPVTATSSQAIKAFANVLTATRSVFMVDDNEITVDGDYITSLNLKDGDHLLGAIFENSEKTTDVKKVILSIMGSNTDPENPSEPETPNKPETPTNPETPNKPETPTNPGGNNGGSSEGSGSSGGGSGKAPVVQKPTVPDDGGTFTPNPDNPYDVDYRDKNGNPVNNKWVGNGKNWYHVNEKSKLDYDWFLDKNDSTWYMLERNLGNNFGAAKSGWYYEIKDQKWYYLNPNSTAMLLGWQLVNGKWYYLTPVNGGQTYFGDNINGWIYDTTKPWKPLGSMYQDEKTPDGYFVDDSGSMDRLLKS